MMSWDVLVQTQPISPELAGYRMLSFTVNTLNPMIASDDTELLVAIGGVKREVLQANLKELRARGARRRWPRA